MLFFFFNPKIPIPSLQLHQLSCLYIHIFSQQTPKGMPLKKKKIHIAGASEFVCLRVYVWIAFCASSIQRFLVGPIHYLRDPQVLFLKKNNFKIGSFGTIHIFKNVLLQCFQFLIFSFQFSVFNNKQYPNKTWEREWRTKGLRNCLNYMHQMEERDLIAILKSPIIRYSLIFRTFFSLFLPFIGVFVESINVLYEICWKLN